MKILRFKKIYNYTELLLFGIKISHKSKKELNKYISLGTNCFPRMKLNQFQIKPSKEHGELSCPFDLCQTPIESVKAILENDFEDYFQDLYFDEERKIWKNKKYNINYLHDNLNKEEFIKRYKQRIENFRNIAKTKKNLVFIQVLFNHPKIDILKSDIKAISNCLQNYCTYNFKYKIINLIQSPKTPKKKYCICKNTYYYELQSPYDENWTKWWTEETDKQPKIKPLISKCIKTIRNNQF